MPPDGKLADQEIQAIERWVAEGAVWPDTAAVSRPSDAPTHWSFVPVRNRILLRFAIRRGLEQTLTDSFCRVSKKVGCLRLAMRISMLFFDE